MLAPRYSSASMYNNSKVNLRIDTFYFYLLALNMYISDFWLLCNIRAALTSVRAQNLGPYTFFQAFIVVYVNVMILDGNYKILLSPTFVRVKMSKIINVQKRQHLT